MPLHKIYKCCVCHEVLEDYKPIRLVKQKYGKGKYKQYSNVATYDFCKKCYAKFNGWIKNKKEGDRENGNIENEKRL